eukprot:gene36638-43673_t
MLRGAEDAQSYRWHDGALVPHGESVRLLPGVVEAVSPQIDGLDDIHRVRNTYDDRVSISIHVYGANIGAVRRTVYLPDGTRKEFISGYSNTTLPNIWDFYEQVRAALLARQEIALLDVREEAPHAIAHPLFAANLPLSRLELLVYTRIPRRDTVIVVLDDGEGLAATAAARLSALGYSDVAILAGGIRGWQADGGELFQDVNEVQALLDSKADLVVLDA